MADLKPEPFDPETAALLGRAFDAAWNALQGDGADRLPAIAMERMREAVAAKIIEMAQGGERDAEKLREGALAFAMAQNGGSLRTRG